ncbi:energy transducer TonB [Novosphingobium sp. BL-52-GroH]|uniref:energy transducer TonB n=1 Tax=Novosphingobium sp. BL-52-GroH TaxID=3349877 RepID=UPI00384D6176
MTSAETRRRACLLALSVVVAACSPSPGEGPVDTTIEEPSQTPSPVETAQPVEVETPIPPDQGYENLDGDEGNQPYGDDASATPQTLVPVRDEPELISRAFADNYPTRAAREEREGGVTIAVDVSAQGRVTHCTVASSSGSPDLDEAACDAALRRARYRPATDAAGVPVATTNLRQTVSYTLN